MIVVVEAEKKLDGHSGKMDRHTGRYHAYVDGERILESVRTPFYDAARLLLKRGIDPETVLELQHKGSPIIAMRGKLSHLAVQAVRENRGEGPVVIPYQPFSRPPSARE